VVKILILGGNSQVGAEVALYLKTRAGIDLTCAVRSEYSSALFRVAGIKYKVIDYKNSELLKETMGTSDVVVEFAYPAGQLVEIQNTIRGNFTAVFRAMAPGSKFVNMSSIMAFGMPGNSSVLKDYFLPRTSYGLIKRKSERIASDLGKQFGISVYNFRLGQVHGLLQSVSQEFINNLAGNEFSTNGTAASISNTVFASSVGEAVLGCAFGEIKPDLYTVVSSPQWSLEELFDYYRSRYQLTGRPRYSAGETRNPSLYSVLLQHAKVKFLSLREILETYVLLRAPSLFPRAKGIFRIKSVADDIASLNHRDRPTLHHLLGEVPGRVLSQIKSSPVEVMKADQELELVLLQSIEERKNGT